MMHGAPSQANVMGITFAAIVLLNVIAASSVKIDWTTFAQHGPEYLIKQH